LIKVWDPETANCELNLRGHRNHVHGVTWDPSGRYLASASMDKTVKVWRVSPLPAVEQSRPPIAGHAGGVQAIAWCEDSLRLRSLGLSDNSIATWNVLTGDCLHKAPVPKGRHGQFSRGAGVAALMATSVKPVGLMLFDAASGEQLQSFEEASPMI